MNQESKYVITLQESYVSSGSPIFVLGSLLLFGVQPLPGSVNGTLRSYEFVANGEGAEHGRGKTQVRKKSKAYGAFRPLRPVSAHNLLLAFISVADELPESAQASTGTTVL